MGGEGIEIVDASTQVKVEDKTPPAEAEAEEEEVVDEVAVEVFGADVEDLGHPRQDRQRHDTGHRCGEFANRDGYAELRDSFYSAVAKPLGDSHEVLYGWRIR